MREQTEASVVLSQAELLEFCGNNDEKIRELQSHLDAKLILRGNRLKIVGKAEDVERTSHVIQEILEVVRQKGRLSDQQFRSAMRYAAERARSGLPPTGGGDEDGPVAAFKEPGAGEKLTDYMLEPINVPLRRRRLSPLTATQRDYVAAIRSNTIIFGIGPAGTGKTYLAMAMAVASLTAGEVNRIILCRPAVEAGERLGFLPGDLAQKFDPYVRPLWDALYEMMEAEKIREAVASGVIEIAPLAYMRGRTLNNAFVILDEGQNTSIEQMKMFLTRLGFESKAVITGDVTQIDLPRGQMSGLIHAERVLQGIEGVGFARFQNRDVVRHPLLTKIINAYEAEKKAERESGESGRSASARQSAPAETAP